MVVYWGNAHSSSDYIYRGDEQAEVFPFGSYSESKYLCERLVAVYRKNYSLDITVVRPCFLYGLEMKPQWLIPKLIHKALNNEEIVTHKYNNGLPLFELLYIDDFCTALSFLVKSKDSPACVNIGSHNHISTLDLASMIIKLTHSTSRKELLHISDNVYNVVSTAGYIDKIGWKPNVELTDGLQLCIKHHLSHPSCHEL